MPIRLLVRILAAGDDLTVRRKLTVDQISTSARMDG